MEENKRKFELSKINVEEVQDLGDLHLQEIVHYLLD